MPPQATGFRYTPSSYLQRTRVENRPWTDGSGEEDDMGVMKQEDRPSRKETSIDSHFQSRVNRRKQAYRSIIKGEDEPAPMPDDPLTSENEAEIFTSNTNAVAAREARQKRLTQKEPIVNETGTEASKIRNLRAHRLRNSMKASSEESDSMETLQRRRLQQAEQDRLDHKELVHRERSREEELRRMEAERRSLVEERRDLELAKRQAAAQLGRQRSPSPSSLEEQRKPKRKQRKKEPKSLPEPEFPEFSLLEEVQLLFRDSGLLTTCVTGCFGEDIGEDTEEEDPPRNKNSSSNRRRRTPYDEDVDDDVRVDEF